ncbi:peptidyl-tRNA hydrolase 2 [Glonium stellatum]|uniref:peptidyl-tRNA hydrolase n=1 Tax=Glonium stellatum TaxID=574774 RepID=A0A8E2F8E8_9PEZI|nr:peptidyl-tRNA hydrolase 2 [Glonium stellatum]
MASTPDRPPPTTAAIAAACALIAGVTGYFIGQASAIGFFGGSRRKQLDSSKRNVDGSDSSSDGEVEQEKEDGQELESFAGSNEECKLVLVARTDLGMTKGKIAAQCSHATLACYKYFLRKAPDSLILRRWERYGQMKVALQVKSEDELETLQAQAQSLGMCAQIIHDAGRTQIASGSATVLGIGPAPKSMVDQVTGHLKLL